MGQEPDRNVEFRLRAAVESAPNGMVMVDPDGCIVLVNREVERLFGYVREELLGQKIDVLVPERFRDAHPGFRQQFFHNPGTRAMGAGRDLYGLRKDGTEVPVEIGLNPIETDEGLFVLSSIVDISFRVAAEQEKQHLEAQLRQSQKMEALGTMASGVAHDFNNVLAGILSHAELLQESVREEQQHADLQQLIDFANRGREVVERILAFSRRQDTVRRPVALDRIVDEVSRMLRSSVAPNIRITTDVDSTLPRVFADPSGIHQMLLNLGMNAAHAMPEGGILEFQAEKVYVTDSMARNHPQLGEGTHAIISVRDTGTGMDEEVQARAFEPFFTTKQADQGTGLGLSIVHRIVQDNGGSLDLQSTPGAGTTVRCILPVAAEDETKSEPAPATIGHGSGQRILLVDDDPSLAQVGELRLARLGYTPTVTASSAEALRLIREDPSAFDAVITDYLMPEMNGMELGMAISRIRRDIPILMFTGYIEDFDTDTVNKAGIRRLLQKPATLNQLDEALRQVLDGEGGPNDGPLPRKRH